MRRLLVFLQLPLALAHLPFQRRQRGHHVADDGIAADAQAPGDFGVTQFLEAAEHEDFAATRRQAVDHAHQPRKLAAIEDDILWRGAWIGDGLRHLLVLLQFDPVADMALVVERQVRCDTEETAARVVDDRRSGREHLAVGGAHPRFLREILGGGDRRPFPDPCRNANNSQMQMEGRAWSTAASRRLG